MSWLDDYYDNYIENIDKISTTIRDINFPNGKMDMVILDKF